MTHSDLLAIVLLQLWFCSDYLFKIHPLGRFFPPNNPSSSVFLSFHPKRERLPPYRYCFPIKNRPPGFSSTTTLIGPAYRTDWGCTDRIVHGQAHGPTAGKRIRASWPPASLPAPHGPGGDEKWPCCALPSEPEALQCRCGARWPAGHQDFFTSWTPVSPPPPKEASVSSSWVQGGHADGYILSSPWTSVNKSSSQPLTNTSWFVVSKWGICRKGKS